MRRFAILPALALLAACGTPLERCLDEATRDLARIDAMIGETRANIERGYALERVEVRRRGTVICRRPDGTAQFCSETYYVTENRRKDIVVEAERAKLGVLIKRRDEIATDTEPKIASCRATYPAQ